MYIGMKGGYPAAKPDLDTTIQFPTTQIKNKYIACGLPPINFTRYVCYKTVILAELKRQETIEKNTKSAEG